MMNVITDSSSIWTQIIKWWNATKHQDINYWLIHYAVYLAHICIILYVCTCVGTFNILPLPFFGHRGTKSQFILPFLILVTILFVQMLLPYPLQTWQINMPIPIDDMVRTLHHTQLPQTSAHATLLCCSCTPRQGLPCPVFDLIFPSPINPFYVQPTANPEVLALIKWPKYFTFSSPTDPFPPFFLPPCPQDWIVLWTTQLNHSTYPTKNIVAHYTFWVTNSSTIQPVATSKSRPWHTWKIFLIVTVPLGHNI